MKNESIFLKFIDILKTKGFNTPSSVRYADAIIKSLPNDTSEDRNLLQKELTDLSIAIAELAVSF